MPSALRSARIRDLDRSHGQNDWLLSGSERLKPPIGRIRNERLLSSSLYREEEPLIHRPSFKRSISFPELLILSFRYHIPDCGKSKNIMGEVEGLNGRCAILLWPPWLGAAGT